MIHWNNMNKILHGNFSAHSPATILVIFYNSIPLFSQRPFHFHCSIGAPCRHQWIHLPCAVRRWSFIVADALSMQKVQQKYWWRIVKKTKSGTKKVESFCHTRNILHWNFLSFKSRTSTNGDYSQWVQIFSYFVPFIFQSRKQGTRPQWAQGTVVWQVEKSNK